MSNLYPLRFSPIFKERLWGGQQLKTVLNKDIPNGNIGESWEISAVHGNISTVKNGALQGQNLKQLIRRYKDQLVGPGVWQRFGDSFPVLVKFIDARLDLSVQLHPDDVLANKRHNSFGKTEMWYIMQAKTNSRLILGFNKILNRQTYADYLRKNKLPEILRYEKVKPGDAYFIEPGTVHAIGAGILLAEIQQTSDITYRIYDFDRVDKEGNKRQLHTQEALDAINFQAGENCKITYQNKKNNPSNLVSSEYFTVNFCKITEEKTVNFSGRNSFTLYICVKGALKIQTQPQSSVTLSVGESVIIPFVFKQVQISTTEAELLEVYI